MLAMTVTMQGRLMVNELFGIVMAARRNQRKKWRYFILRKFQ